jgi:glycerol-3-phosphate dehydrogenase
MSQTAASQSATVLNYIKVVGSIKEKNIVSGVPATDLENGEEFEIRAKGIINTTVVFTDDIVKMDDVNAEKMITLSQGIHIVLDKSFLPGTSAIMVPHTADGRVLFATPGTIRS